MSTYQPSLLLLLFYLLKATNMFNVWFKKNPVHTDFSETSWGHMRNCSLIGFCLSLIYSYHLNVSFPPLTLNKSWFRNFEVAPELAIRFHGPIPPRSLPLTHPWSRLWAVTVLSAYFLTAYWNTAQSLHVYSGTVCSWRQYAKCQSRDFIINHPLFPSPSFFIGVTL